MGALVAGRNYASNEEHLADDAPVFLRATVEMSGPEPALMVEEVIPIAEARERLTRHVVLNLGELARDETIVERVTDVIRSSAGDTPFYLQVRGSNGLTVVLKSEPGGVRASTELLWELGELVGEDKIIFAGPAAS